MCAGVSLECVAVRQHCATVRRNDIELCSLKWRDLACDWLNPFHCRTMLLLGNKHISANSRDKNIDTER